MFMNQNETGTRITYWPNPKIPNNDSILGVFGAGL